MLFIRCGYAVFIIVTHLQIERNPRDGCRYLDTLCPKEELISRQKLLLGFVLTSQGIPFVHSGQEYCRSKQGYQNSYNLPDEINKLRPEDKVTYREVIDFTRELIRIRKEYQLSKKAEQIRKEVSFEEYQDCLVYNLKNCAGRDLKIIFNPTEEEVEYDYSVENITSTNFYIYT